MLITISWCEFVHLNIVIIIFKYNFSNNFYNQIEGERVKTTKFGFLIDEIQPGIYAGMYEL